MASKKEIQIIQYIRHSVKAYGRMPSSKELCIDVEIGRGSLNRILNRLEKKKVLISYTHNPIPYKLNGK